MTRFTKTQNTKNGRHLWPKLSTLLVTLAIISTFCSIARADIAYTDVPAEESETCYDNTPAREMIEIRCLHENASILYLVAPTCHTPGLQETICYDCNAVIDRSVVYPAGHMYDEYVLTLAPTATANGEEVRTCKSCGSKDVREYVCPHENTSERITQKAACTKAGSADVKCDFCGAKVKQVSVDPTGHSYGDFVITAAPTPEADGEQTRTCKTCGNQEKRKYVCPHDKTSKTILQNATCTKAGSAKVTCKTCKVTIKEVSIDPTNHNYGDWTCTSTATPTKSGERSKSCSSCGKTVTESYSMSMPGKNSIYIPGTGICHKFVVSSFTQSSVDSYDIVYSVVDDWGSDDIFVLGHNTGTMRYLHKTKVGQYIYLSVNGKIETYKVVVSEFGMQNSNHSDITGQTTGSSIWDSVGSKTLHMYTCYGSNKNGRWMILAKLV